ncbi:tetratricopeptide repeat protein [Thiovibrio frasassiensis]|uniref:Tetratricopeptide repeat protein n=1 Tax=Thiovibrio frasassiensis TaxID=2984131 RepID=A0A9X4MER9_9BACT|nr:tetratricopeptide repeat protein [Thiovibrio frasassiensis]MDG4474918.1 tetratricopeptide repeat protein [Thiovibrio frasassiensis]
MRYQAKTVLVFSSYIMLMVTLTGCAGVGKVAYRPVPRPDMTCAVAVDDILNAARAGKIYTATGPFTPVRHITNIIVNENGTVRWELTPEPGLPRAFDISLLAPRQDFAVNEWGPSWAITLPGFMIAGSLPNLTKVADDLYVIQQSVENLTERQNKELALFQTIAAKYRALAIKPPVSEEQRKFVVQANAFNERKEYTKAIDLYQKAIEVDPVSYPPAYFNLALLSAQIQWFKSAIRYMKQYLLLVPDAKDARSGQDKIYEWEAMVNK